MEVKAKISYFHVSPRKARLVANLVKGMDVRRAVLELENLPKRFADVMLKLLHSAVANATNNFHLDKEGLYIKNLIINPGTTLKRFQPRAFGRASPIRKRTSHIVMIIGSKVDQLKQEEKHKKTGPAIREITAEDIKESSQIRSPENRSGSESSVKPKPVEFVKRMFRRKVI